MDTSEITELDAVLAEGEGQRVEFKASSSRLDREFVALANAGGGVVYVGVNDDGTIAGVDTSNRFLSQVYDIARNCDPPVAIAVQVDPRRVIAVRVPEGADKPYRCRDGFFLRIGPNAQKLTRDEIIRMVLTEGRRRFDEQLVPTFSFPRDFAPERLATFLRLCDVQSDADPADILHSLDCARPEPGGLAFCNAGALFFAKDPQQFVRESFVTGVRYQGTDRFNVVDRCDIFGDPVEMVEETLKFVQRNMRVAYRITGDARRNEVHEYPLAAVREAVVNAVMHRDYGYDASHVYVHLYADRLEIENPGGLYPGLTLDELGSRSVRRNRVVADLLYRAGYVERIGSGIARMRRALADNGNPPFEVTATSFFIIRFFPRLAAADAAPLSARQNKVYQYVKGRGEASSSEIAHHLGVSGDTARRELTALLARGVLVKAGIGKATVYRATD